MLFGYAPGRFRSMGLLFYRSFLFSANLYKKFGLLQTFIDLAYIELLSGEKLLPTTDTDVRDLELVRKSFTAVVKLNTSRT